MMKRLLNILIILLIPSVALAQTWYTANQVTLGWSAVTTLVDGSQIPATDSIQYQIYKKLNSVATETPVGGETTAVQQLITFDREGAYLLGVKSLRYVSGEKVSESDISWSSDPAVCSGNQAFGVKYYIKPNAAINLLLLGGR